MGLSENTQIYIFFNFKCYYLKIILCNAIQCLKTWTTIQLLDSAEKRQCSNNRKKPNTAIISFFSLFSRLNISSYFNRLINACLKPPPSCSSLVFTYPGASWYPPKHRSTSCLCFCADTWNELLPLGTGHPLPSYKPEWSILPTPGMKDWTPSNWVWKLGYIFSPKTVVCAKAGLWDKILS